jgi:hypothetical protein
MTLTLTRYDANEYRTIGKLYADGAFVAYTLEDPVRPGPKLAHETAIPAGTYPVTITKSQRFGVNLPLVQHVPEFTGIRIHAGNTTADTSGCVLVGFRRGRNVIYDSRAALAAVQVKIAEALARGESVTMTVTDALPEGTLVA